MPDKVEKIGHSLIQHGEDNERVYLMKLDPRDRAKIISEIETLAKRHRYGKIFCKVPEWAKPLFERNQYRLRAHIPDFYQNDQDVFFMSKFLDLERRRIPHKTEDTILSTLKLAKSKAGSGESLKISSGYRIHKLNKTHLHDLARIYDRVYASYPFPITDPDYLESCMRTHVEYYGTFKSMKLIAAASAEKDNTAGNAEMTDFATLPEHRGQGLATALLIKMEQAMRKQNIRTLFTIARALSPGINITFARCGYQYSGTLINNTQISGQIESMNVWYKHLPSATGQ